jgi:hemolysin activation/secretion protein
LVGYFRASGFFHLYKSLEKAQKIRILVGINVNRQTQQLLSQAQERQITVKFSHKEAKDVFAEDALEKFEALWKDSVEISEKYVETVNSRTWLNDISRHTINRDCLNLKINLRKDYSIMLIWDELKELRLGIFVVFFLASLVYAGFAEADSPPPGEDAGSQASRFKAESEREMKELQEEKIKKSEIELPKEKEPIKKEGPTSLLKDVSVTGATVFRAEEFRSIYEPYLDNEIIFADLEIITGKIKEKYLEKGFVTTIVYMPQQDITSGSVEIRVVEGKLGDVKIEGNRHFSTGLIQRYFHTMKNEILSSIKLQKDLLRINKNPDLEVKAVIEKGKEPGTTDVILKVKDKLPHHFGFGMDNQGTRVVGKDRVTGLFRSTNLTGNNDSLYINELKSKSSFGSFASYTLPLDTYGTKIGFDYTYFYTDLKKEYESSNIIGKTHILVFRILKELGLSDYFQIDADMGIEIKSVHKRTSGSITTNDQLRMPYIKFDITKIDAFLGGGQTTFSPKFTFNIKDDLGSSSHDHPSASRNGTGGGFYKYEQALQRVQRMPFESRLSLNSQSQFTSDDLPSSEQFQLGGANSIRGYPEGDYICDTGTSLNIEWVFPMYLIPKECKLPRAEMPLKNQIQPALFVDIGAGKLNNDLPGETPHKYLAGAGGGFRIHFNNNMYVKLDWAKHIGDRQTQGMSESTFHMSIQFEL